MNNKRLLALFALPLILSLMVLPLCSFTTVDGSPDGYSTYTYNPALYTQVGYTYHRTTSTIDTYYYSVIPNLNQTIVAYDIDADDNPVLDLSRIKTYASDYLIAGSDSFNYNSQTVSSNPSVYYSSSNPDIIGADVSLYSERPSSSYFTGYFGFEGLILPNDTSKNGLNDTSVKLLSSTDSLPIIAEELYCNIHIQYVKDYSGEFIYGDAYSGVYLENIPNVIVGDFVSFNTILKYCLDNTLFYDFPDNPDGIISNLSYQYIKQVDFNFVVFDTVDTGFSQVISGIILRDLLYNYNGNNEYVYTIEDFIADYYYEIGVDAGFANGYAGGVQQGFDQGYDVGYDAGYDIGFDDGSEQSYDIGYADGVDNAPAEWGSIGQFLVNVLSAFTSAQLFPGVTIGSLLGLIAGGLLLLMFLKMFAGG